MKLSNKFICAGEDYETINHFVPAPWFRKIITVKKAFKKVSLTVCALGFYELFLNGNCITKGKFCPYISNSDDIVFYDDYDITDIFSQDENELKFLLGNGMQNAFGGFVWEFDKAKFRSSPKLAFSLEITYCDGEKEVFEADKTVETCPSNIVSNDLRLGEVYDATFSCSSWRNSVMTTPPKGEKMVSHIKPIVCRKEISPIKIWKENDSYIYDFGENAAGVCRLNVIGKENQKITLLFGEVLKDGKFYIDNTTFDNVKDRYYQRDIYICKEGRNIWQPTFTYHGFRYVKVDGITEKQATDELLTYIFFNTDLGKVGSFECDDEKVNTLHRMSLNSTLSNFHHFPTDCPQREKNGWTADAALSSSHTLLYFEPVKNYRQWLKMVCKSQRSDGALPGIVPTTGWGFDWGNGPAWDAVITEIPYQIWQKRNDITVFKDCSECILKYINYLKTRLNDIGLLAIGLGDWCAPHNPVKAPLELTDSIEAYDISLKAALMFEKTEDTINAEHCRDFAKFLREKIRKYLYNENDCVFIGNCQTSQAMGIYYNIIEENEREKAVKVLLSLVKESNYHIDTGVLGGRVLFHTLAENGEIDTALRILKNPTAPSYMQWINNGDTTLCEGFDQEDGIDSHNHHFWGNISAFFLEQICGIKPCGDKININPNLPSEMNSAAGSFDSVFGRICVNLVRNGETVNANIDYDKNAPIKIDLPKHYILR